ncbi:PepSY domain-containing protein [Actinoplanes sp. NBRC 103695]|uniref:PepSY-associated TM helix domain-containing protein n=1 Tax=Actinoplanes sp. NBRC 103695 TaxID=3032202 RepID=UPI0024A58CF7|nr:PepSY domain-containing protein [Actinoplanes sp. NBRC 103695]GLZ01141.1 membrane protein [Actinoplanes sp. NBRC 103695]
MSAEAPPTDAPPAARARSAKSAKSIGPLLLRVHFYAGILVAPFLLVAALTGLAYAFTPQMERAYYADEFVVSSPGGTVKPLSEQLTAARATHPEGAITAIRPGGGEKTTQIDFTSPELDEEHAHTVYVNPYNAQVTGQLTTWWGSSPLRTWFDDLHTNLNLGTVGFFYSELAASWLWVIALGGVILWFRRQRGKRMLRPDLKAGRGVRRTRSFHASTGLWLSIGLLFLSATGLTWSDYAGVNFGNAVDALHGSRPAVSTELAGATPAATGGGHHGGGAAPAEGTPADLTQIDEVWQVAEANGITGSPAITVPADNQTAWNITEMGALWPMDRDGIAVDGATGQVTDRIDYADWPVMAKLTQIGIYAHMGDLFGLPNQLLLAALAIGLITVIIWGYRMWWQRRPTRNGTRAIVGAPPVGPGAWQQLPAWAIIAGVPVILAIGYFLPVLGVSLVAFLAIDLLLGAVRNRRRTTTIPVSPAPAGTRIEDKKPVAAPQGESRQGADAT